MRLKIPAAGLILFVFLVLNENTSLLNDNIAMQLVAIAAVLVSLGLFVLGLKDWKESRTE